MSSFCVWIRLLVKLMPQSPINSSRSNLTSTNLSEEDKITQMLSDSGDYYNQKNWLQLRGRSAYAGQRVPPGYKCNRCGKTGHFIYDCPEGKSRMGFGFSMEFLVEIRILTLQFQVQTPWVNNKCW